MIGRKIQVTKEFTDDFINIKKSQEVNGWSYVNTNKVREWKSILAFNYLINTLINNYSNRMNFYLISSLGCHFSQIDTPYKKLVLAKKL